MELYTDEFIEECVKLRELIEEYLKINPIDNGRTHYEYDSALQEGRNEVKGIIQKLLKESKK